MYFCMLILGQGEGLDAWRVLHDRVRIGRSRGARKEAAHARRRRVRSDGDSLLPTYTFSVAKRIACVKSSFDANRKRVEKRAKIPPEKGRKRAAISPLLPPQFRPY